jgi:hypothetical protein
MTALGIVDRTNVTAAQETGRRIHVDDIWYARLGYGTVFGDRSYGTPAVGFGYRAELDRLAIDISFLNFQIGSGDHRSPGASAASWVRLSGLYFLNPTASLTAYFGGGLSYGRRRVSRGWNYTPTGPFSTDWEGGGLQGELTVGCEIARATNLRLFVQRGSDRRRRESPPPKPPARGGFGRASLTARPRPPSWYAFSSLIAFCASSSVLISTNANPRARPVAMSRMTLTVSTVPARAKSS